MDPDAALAELRSWMTALSGLTKDWEPGENVDHDALIEEAIEGVTSRFSGLDEWLTKDGFLPRDWWDEEAKNRG